MPQNNSGAVNESRFAYGCRIKIVGEPTRKYRYMVIHLFPVHGRYFLDYIDVRKDKFSDRFRFRPVVQSSDILGRHVEMKAINPHLGMEELEGINDE